MNQKYFILKIFSLTILDIITFLLTFTAWALVNIALYPWAIGAIIFSLALVNIAVLLFDYGVRQFGIAVSTSALTVTFLYYLFVMVFTGLSYLTISPRWYLIIILLGFLVYVAILSGLYLSGNLKAADNRRHKTERNQTRDLNLLLMGIARAIKESNGLIEKASHKALTKTFQETDERIKASTPFGRKSEPDVVQMENQITMKLDAVYDNLSSLNDAEEKEEKVNSVSAMLSEVKNLVMDREKLIIQ